MKKSTFLLIGFISLVGFATVQKAKLVGSWLMTKAIVDGKIEQPYFITEFKNDGKFQLFKFFSIPKRNDK